MEFKNIEELKNYLDGLNCIQKIIIEGFMCSFVSFYSIDLATDKDKHLYKLFKEYLNINGGK